MAVPQTWPSRVRSRYGWRLAAMPFLLVLTVVTIVLIAQSPAPASSASSQAALSVSSPMTGTAPAVAAATTTGAPTAGASTTDAPTTDAPTTGAPTTEAPTTGSPSTDAAVAGAATVAGTSEGAAERTGDGVAPQTGAPAVIATDPAEVLTPNLAVGALPAGAPYVIAGAGTYRVVGGAGAPAGTSPTVVTYTVEIEDGVTPAEGDEGFAQFVDRTLADPRSWITVKGVTLQRVDAGTTPDFRVTLASQQTVRGMCGFSVPLESSCYTRTEGRVVINDSRWVRGSLTYGTDLNSYREYAINHEVGHALGYGHQPCGANGALAPVMMQQSWSASNDALAGINGSVAADGKSCLPNPWPDPSGAEGAATATTG